MNIGGRRNLFIEYKPLLMSSDIRKMKEDEFTKMAQQFIYLNHVFIRNQLLNLK